MNFLNFLIIFGIFAIHTICAWEHQERDHPRHAKYAFKYGVKDPETGDIKDHWEQRDGDHVRGAYSLKEADGTTRVVEYYADAEHGFHAIVRKIGIAHHPASKQQRGKHGSHAQATSYINVQHF